MLKLGCCNLNSNVEEILKQDHCPVLLRSRKLNNYQINYKVTDKELLSIVDTLVEHRSIPYGAKMFVCSDHKNLTHANATHASARVQIHRLSLEEFGCTAFHMPGEKNELADALSRLPMKNLCT